MEKEKYQTPVLELDEKDDKKEQKTSNYWETPDGMDLKQRAILRFESSSDKGVGMQVTLKKEYGGETGEVVSFRRDIRDERNFSHELVIAIKDGDKITSMRSCTVDMLEDF